MLFRSTEQQAILAHCRRHGIWIIADDAYERLWHEAPAPGLGTADFASFRDTFADWTFTNTDFEAIPLRPRDMVYADPPYDVPFTQYASTPFRWPEQQRTAAWLACHRGPVILSNQATPRIVALYRSLGYDLSFLEAPRRISCTGSRTPACEVLATRNLDVALLDRLRPRRWARSQPSRLNPDAPL